jgi:hypothetical protein
MQYIIIFIRTMAPIIAWVTEFEDLNLPTADPIESRLTDVH